MCRGKVSLSFGSWLGLVLGQLRIGLGLDMFRIRVRFPHLKCSVYHQIHLLLSLSFITTSAPQLYTLIYIKYLAANLKE